MAMLYEIMHQFNLFLSVNKVCTSNSIEMMKLWLFSGLISLNTSS